MQEVPQPKCNEAGPEPRSERTQPGPALRFMRRPRSTVYLIAFVTGAIVMSFEMLGSRYLNPYFGSGIYTWASLISTVLMALTAGYFVGGYLADRAPSLSVLALPVLAASALSARAAELCPAGPSTGARARGRHSGWKLDLRAGPDVLAGHLARHVFAFRDPAAAAFCAQIRTGFGYRLWRVHCGFDRRHAGDDFLFDSGFWCARDHPDAWSGRLDLGIGAARSVTFATAVAPLCWSFLRLRCLPLPPVAPET